MASPTDNPNWHKEFLGSFTGGMDANTDPLKLDREQLAYSENLTVRGQFARPRPPHRQIQFAFSGVPPTNFLTQLFQTSGVYKDDYGNSYLMAQIGGRLYKVLIAGTIATVTEIPIGAEASPAQPVAVPQAWMWQIEKWMMITNGQSLPIFWDGNIARRSDGSIVRQVGIIAAPGYTPAKIGSSAVAPLTSNYTDKLNIVLQIFNATSGLSYGLFQAISSASTNSTYLATFLNVNDTPGNAIPVNAQFIVPANPGVVGTTRQLGSIGNSQPAIPGSLTIHLALLAPPPPNIVGFANGLPGKLTIKFQVVGGGFGFLTPTFTFQNISGSSFDAVFSSNPNPSGGASTVTSDPISTETGIVVTPVPPSPAYPVGIVVTAAVVPAVGATVDVEIDRAYSGVPGFPVILSTSLKNYQVTAKAGTVTPATVNLINLSSINTASNPIPSGSLVKTVQELPPARMGVYGLGRSWQSLIDGRSFIGSDVVGGPSGTPANQFRDAPLRVTENAALVGGSPFAVPGSGGEIRAMIFATTLDASLGQGPLQVFTPNSVFSCIAPTIADRLSWATITNPILTQSLIGSGALGQDSTFANNGDTMFRSQQGFGDLILGRREFSTWGNVPISKEVDPIISQDNQALLQFGSGLVFDNRSLMLSGTLQTNLGVVFQKIIALNFDPVSSLRGKAPSVYDGVWTGLNVLKIMKGDFSGIEKCYAFCLDPGLTQIQLYEILPSATTITDDDGFAVVSDAQSASLFNRDVDPRKRQFLMLENGEIFVDNLVGRVIFEFFYKPDQYPGWIPWLTWEEFQTPDNPPEFRPRMGLGSPSLKNCDAVTNRPFPYAYTYQFRWRITGQCTFKGARFKAVEMPEPEFAPMKCATVVFPPVPPLAPPIPPEQNVFTSTIPILIRSAAGPGPTGSPYPPAAGAVLAVSISVTRTSRLVINIIGLAHDKPQDIKLILVGPPQPLAPSGSAVWLLLNNGGTTPISNVNLTYDIFATNNRITTAPLVTGLYADCSASSSVSSGVTGVSQPLSGSELDFISQNPNGTWSLYAFSAAGTSTGIIAGGWSLTIT